MKINGKYLAWAIIHLIIFMSLFFADIGLEFETFKEAYFLLFYIGLLVFFGWRFIKNTEEAFA